jgi:hypothetical protein
VSEDIRFLRRYTSPLYLTIDRTGPDYPTKNQNDQKFSRMIIFLLDFEVFFSAFLRFSPSSRAS